MKSEPITTLAQASTQATNDEISLFEVASSLGRHKTLIAGVTFAAGLLSVLNAFTQKPVWEGQFQIVLEQQSRDVGQIAQLANSIPLISSLGGLNSGSKTQLETEVRVLQSPLVLKPTYEFVKEIKAKAGHNVKNMTFRGWRDANLNINLEKGTSILNISYRDTDLNLILPVINRISADYQLYSKRDRSKSITNGLSFAKEKAVQFREKAEASSRALDAFSIRYGIFSNDKTLNGSNIDISKFGSNENLGLASKAGDVEVQRHGNALDQLASINQELIRRQQRFTENDPGVLALISERDALRRYIEVTGGGFLSLPDEQPGSKENAQEILLKYQELKRTAKRDLSTLDSLESSLLSLQLEQARQTDPWELISTPTILEQPVAPHKKKIVTAGLLSGFLLGSCIALIVDRRSGLVFTEDELRNLLASPLLKRLAVNQINNLTMACELLATGPLSKAQKIALVPVGEPNSNYLDKVTQTLKSSLKERTLVVSNDLMKTRTCDTQLLIVQPGKCNRKGLAQIQQSLALQGTNVEGWLLLDNRTNVL